MAVSDVHPVHSFHEWQVWPGSYDNPPANGRYPLPDERPFSLDKSTPITSMGSCFAREIKTVLLREGYAYLTEETDHPASKHAGAAWERVYNTFSMRQIFDYTFGEWNPNIRWWKAPESGVIQDPYRRVILYPDLQAAETDFAAHRECSRRVLETARVLILTLGLTEVWRDKEDGSVICLPSGPYVNEGGDMSRYEFHVSGYEENLDNLRKIHGYLAKRNPECRVVVTVSPVHLWATFRTDVDVIAAGCASKSILRAAADQFARDCPHVVYFPAYEMATIFRPMEGFPIFAQGRENFHVNADTVNFIMGEFFRRYA